MTANSFSYSRRQDNIAAESSLDGLYVIRTSVFLCVLAYYAEWHMHKSLREVLFEDEGRAATEQAPSSSHSCGLVSKSNCTRPTCHM
jgi:hypothetical protein